MPDSGKESENADFHIGVFFGCSDANVFEGHAMFYNKHSSLPCFFVCEKRPHLEMS